jgi:hypothetical protein
MTLHPISADPTDLGQGPPGIAHHDGGGTRNGTAISNVGGGAGHYRFTNEIVPVASVSERDKELTESYFP